MRHVVTFLFYHIWLYRKRHIFITLLQIVGPIAFTALFTWNSYNLYSDEHVDIGRNDTVFRRLSEKELYESLRSVHKDCQLGINTITYWVNGTDSNFSHALVTHMKATSFKGFDAQLNFVPVPTENDIIKHSILHNAQETGDCYLGGIVLTNSGILSSKHRIIEQKGKLTVKIRMATYMPSLQQSVLDHTLYYDPKYPRDYLPFIGLQFAIYKSYLELTAESIDPGNADMERVRGMQFNIEPFKYNGIMRHESLSNDVQPLYVIVGIAFVFGEVFMVFTVVRGPAFDKENGFRAYLERMGLRRSLYWASWWLNEFLFRFFVCIFQTLIVFSHITEEMVALVHRGDCVVWFLFILVYSTASISFFIFIASFCKRGVIAPYIAATIWFLSFYFGEVFLIAQFLYADNRVMKMLMCLNPNSALIMGCSVMTRISGGIHWENVMTTTDENKMMLADVLAMLIVDTVFYFVLTMYFDIMRPGTYGTNVWQHCCNSLKARCSCCKKDRGKVRRLFESQVSLASSSPERTHYICFNDVSMRYGKHSPVLKNLSVRIEERKRTAIVGPSGGGKTIISGLIAGAYPPSSGTVIVSGYNAFTERNGTRSIVSLCPDENLLCSHITVMEHLILVGYLRKHPFSTNRRRAHTILEALELTAHANEFPHELVSLQKRKLCIAMALVAKSPIIIFDEPTKGMDQDMRVQVWKFIKGYCRYETILLLTSNISEAYYLSDRIALLTNGRVLGASTKEQLESSLKIGYHIQLKLEPHRNPVDVFTWVEKHVPQCEKLEKHSIRFQQAFELADFRDVRAAPHLSADGTNHEIQSEVFFDALSKVPTIDESDFPDFDYYELDNPGGSKNSIFILLPKSSSDQLSNFFRLLEDEGVRNENGIEGYTFYPYAIDKAYQELEDYMRLNEATKSFDLNEYTWLKEINRQALEESLSSRLDSKFCQRWLSLVYKRIAFLKSVWLHIVFQFLVPIVLFVVVIGATDEYFQTNLEGSELDDSVDRFLDPTFLTRQIHTGNRHLQLYNLYLNHIPPAKYTQVDSFQKKVDSLGDDVVYLLASTYIAGVEISPNESTAFFSPVAFHAAPISVSKLMNAVVELVLADYSVDILAHPIEASHQELLKFYEREYLSFDKNPCSSLTVIFGLGFFCFTSFFIVQPLTERHSRLKRLQLNTGLNSFTFWVSFFVWDTFLVTLFALIVIGILYYVPTHVAFCQAEFIANCFAFFTITGMSSTILAYSLSYVFLQPKSSYFTMVSFNQVTGLFLYVLTTFFSGVTGFAIRTVSRISQPYNVLSGIFNLFTIGVHNSRCELIHPLVRESLCDWGWQKKYGFQTENIDRSCCDVSYSDSYAWKDPKAYWSTANANSRSFYDDFTFDVILIVLHAILGVAIINCREKGWHRKYLLRRHRDSSSFSMMELHQEETDEDLISTDLVNKNNFEIRNVSKQFFLGSKVLHDVSFFAAPGNLISIVGPPKSSKTVLLHILTGFLRETSGRFFFAARSGKQKPGINYLKYVGFAPSQNIFSDIPHMKGITLLKLFARLRGIPSSEVNRHIKKWTTLLGLKHILNVQFEYYNLASRRKIILAMAFIGDPPLLIFDEPLAGIDPFTKRQFWIITDYLRNHLGRIVILATTSVKDIEQRSTKLLFLVNGEVHCYLKPDEIRSEHRGGYRLLFKFKEGVSFKDWTEIQNRISSDLPSSTLENESLNSLEYKIATPVDSELKLSEMFSICQRIYDDHSEIVIDYDVSKETMQHIYETFAQRQRPYSNLINAREEFYMTYC